MDSQEVILVYTDGSSSRSPVKHARGANRPLPGGFAFVAFAPFMPTRLERFGHAYNATNNQMELAAILSALQIIRPTRYPVDLFTDSRYCINAVTVWHHAWARCGWRTAVGEPVQNRPLIEAIVAQVERHREAGGPVSFHYVRGHSGDPENERADYLAGQARLVQLTNIREAVDLPGVTFPREEVAGVQIGQAHPTS